MKVRAVISTVPGESKPHKPTMELITQLRRLGILRIRDIFYTKDATQILVPDDFFAGCDLIVVAGDDTMLEWIINEMKASGANLPIAFFPVGFASDLADTLGLPRTPDAFLSMLMDVHTREVDLGAMDGRYFFQPTSVEATGKRAMPSPKAYYWSDLFPFLNARTTGSIVLDSQEVHAEEDALLFLVSSIGGGKWGTIPLACDASPDDGMLHVILIRKNTPLSRLSMYFRMKRGLQAGHPDVMHFKTQYLRVGRPNDDTAVEMHVMPGALPLVVPRHPILM